MTEDYIAPSLDKDSYHCPHCGSYARKYKGQLWRKKTSVAQSMNSHDRLQEFHAQRCERCDGIIMWAEGKLVHPKKLTAPRPHEHMPKDVERDYEEARQVLENSPRAAAALLRLAIQRLVKKHLDADGGSLYEQIGNLVDDHRISERVQRALDSVRVIGNNSVHPGEMDMDDDKETAEALFRLLNEIVDETIGRDKRIEEVYGSLPEGPKKGIKDRDEN